MILWMGYVHFIFKAMDIKLVIEITYLGNCNMCRITITLYHKATSGNIKAYVTLQGFFRYI